MYAFQSFLVAPVTHVAAEQIAAGAERPPSRGGRRVSSQVSFRMAVLVRFDFHVEQAGGGACFLPSNRPISRFHLLRIAALFFAPRLHRLQP